MNSLTAAAAGEAAAPCSPIDSAVIDLSHSQYRTNDLLGQLERRLESVLKPEPPRPTSDGKPKSVTSGMTSLHTQLLECGERGALLNDRLQEMIDRLVVG